MMDTELRNPGFDDRFTCPSCMHNFHKLVVPAEVACPECGIDLICEVIEEPVAVCRIAGE